MSEVARHSPIGKLSWRHRWNFRPMKTGIIKKKKRISRNEPEIWSRGTNSRLLFDVNVMLNLSNDRNATEPAPDVVPSQVHKNI